MLLNLLAIVLFLAYCYFLINLMRKWSRKDQSSVSQESTILPFISVIIIARNEEKYIAECLDSIYKSQYPNEKFEVIVIDDHSDDQTWKLLLQRKEENLHHYRLEDYIEDDVDNYKKQGIKYAVEKSKGDVILQTDADTRVGEDWLMSHGRAHANHSIDVACGLVFCPVERKNIALEHFQNIDFINTMGITAIGIESRKYHLGNAANLSFSRALYDDYSEQMDEQKHVSGDDIYLIHEAVRTDKNVVFLRNDHSTVITYPEKTWKQFYHQRIRWASKTSSYSDYNLLALIIFIYVFNFSLVFLLFYGLMTLSIVLLTILLAIVVIKYFFERKFIKRVALSTKQNVSEKYLLLASLLYPLYIVIIGFVSIFNPSFRWKNRRVR